MTYAPAQPTLLVFTLGAAREQLRRRLLPAALGRQEREMHRRLLESALAAGRRCGCRLLVSCPEAVDLPPDARHIRQSSGSFGQRLFEALELASSEGGPVLLVGTDVPGLSADHLRQALTALETDPESAVIGPSPDGGLYLLAAHGGILEVLQRIAWCRSSTCRALLGELRRVGRSTLLLEPLRDLDRQRDLLRWLGDLNPSETFWRGFARQVLSLFARMLRPLLEAPPIPTLLQPLPVSAGRAPPHLR